MKKEQELKELKELIKEAILEAFAEIYGTNVSASTPSGGEPVEPQPNGGYGGFSLR